MIFHKLITIIIFLLVSISFSISSTIEYNYKFIFSEDLNNIQEEDEEDLASKENEADEINDIDLTDEVFDKLPVYRIRSEEELGYVQDMLDVNLLQFFYVPYSTKSKKIAVELHKLYKRLNDISGILLINCEEFDPATYKHCQKHTYTADSFPRIRLFVSPEKKYDSKSNQIKRHYDIPFTESTINENSLYEFIISNIKNKGIRLDDYTINSFLNTDLMNKVILFLDNKSDSPGLSYNALSNIYYDQLLFGFVDSSEEEIIKRFRITSFPSLIIFNNVDPNRLMEEPEVILFKGNIENIKAVKEFVGKYALVEKKYLSITRGIQEETSEDISRKVDFPEYSLLNYVNYFEKYNKNKYITVLLNTKNKLKISVKKYLIESHGFLYTIFINCKGKEEKCKEEFKINEFPSLRLYTKDAYSIESKSIDINKSILINPNSNSTFISDFDSFFSDKINIKIQNEASYPFTISEVRDRRRIALISIQNDEQKEINNIIPFKLLSTIPYTNKYIDFIIYNNPLFSVIKDLEVNRIPFLIFYYYEGDKWKHIPVNPDILYSSLNSLAENIIHNRFTKRKIKTFENETIKRFNSDSDIRIGCNGEKTCIIAFVNIEKNDENLENFQSITNRLAILSRRKEYKDYNYGWISTECAGEDLLQYFGFTKANGGLVIYHQWKELYSKILLPVEDYLLMNFFEKTAKDLFPTDFLEIKNFKGEFELCNKEKNEKKKKEKKREKKDDL